MTGRYPLRCGLQTGVIPAPPLDEYLLPEMFREAGRDTAMVGKRHLGHADAACWPMQRGFDSFYGAPVGEIDHFTHRSHGVSDWYRGNDAVEEEGFDNLLFGADRPCRRRLQRAAVGDRRPGRPINPSASAPRGGPPR